MRNEGFGSFRRRVTINEAESGWSGSRLVVPAFAERSQPLQLLSRRRLTFQNGEGGFTP